MAQKYKSEYKPGRRRKDETLIAALDIGASKIACFIARLVDGDGVSSDHLSGHPEIIGVGCHGLPLRSRASAHAEDIEAGVRSAVDAAERMAGGRVSRICLAAPGRYLRSRRIGVDMELAGGYVTEEDIDDSLAEGAAIATPEDCLTLHTSPIDFKVDGADIMSDPIGLSGGILSTEMLGIGVRRSVLDNLSALVERCGLKVDVFAAAPFAAAEATLLEDEKELGVALINIGASSTGYAIYDNGVLIDAGGAPIGSGHITKDIAQIFGTPLAHAERVKTLHGAALIGPGDEHRYLDFPQLGVVGETARASRADLCEVIIPRMEEIFELVAKQWPQDMVRRSGLRRAVITGGGSLLVGAREIAERSLGVKARLGRPALFGGAPEAASAPGFAVCAGLIQNYADFSGEHKTTLGAARQSAHARDKASLFGGVENWLRAKF